MKIGDIVYVAYLAFGRNPTLNKLTVVRVGPKRIVTERGGSRENWTVGQAKFFTTEWEATAALRDAIRNKVAEVRGELTEWEQRLADAETKSVELQTHHASLKQEHAP